MFIETPSQYDRVVVRVVDEDGARVRGAVVRSSHDEQRTSRHGRALLCVADDDFVGVGKRGSFGAVRHPPISRDTETVLVLDRGAPLRIRVVDAAGNPVARAAMVIERDVRLDDLEFEPGGDRAPRSVWTTSARGWARIDWAPTRDAALFVSARSSPLHCLSIEGVRAAGVVRFAAYASPRLRVVVPDDAPPPTDVWMRVWSRVIDIGETAIAHPPPEFDAHRCPLEHGNVRVPWMLAGRSMATAWAEGYGETHVPLDLANGSTDPAGDIVLVPAAAAAARPEWAQLPEWARRLDG